MPFALPINMQAAAKNGVKSPNMLGIGQPGEPAFTVNASDQHAVAIGIDSENNCRVELSGPLKHLSHSGGGHPAAVAIGIDGGEVGFALRSNPSHSGDKGDGGVNTTLVAHSLRGEGFDASEDGTGRGIPIVVAHGQGNAEQVSDGSPSLTCNHEAPIGFIPNAGRHASGMAVRRLTPRECERLQGFPDDFTLVPINAKATKFSADGPRYKALGNSMAVPVIRWLLRRIDLVDELVPINPETQKPEVGSQESEKPCALSALAPSRRARALARQVR